MKKRENVYVRPVTERLKLVTESGICGSSVVEDKNTKTTIDKQKDGGEWGGSGSEFEWD
jgi:hypothetical protein